MLPQHQQLLQPQALVDQHLLFRVALQELASAATSFPAKQEGQ
jgi:hypothetical protein